MTTPPATSFAAVTVACCQLAPQVGDLEHNRRITHAAIRDATSAGATIIVLPELASSGYVFADNAEARALAEPLDGPTVLGWADQARELDVTVVAGLCENGRDGHLYNTAVIVDASGLLASYRKAHLWDTEKTVFTPGDAAPPVVHTAGHRMAPLICYDIDFAEWARLPALAGADLLCVPANWPRYGQASPGRVAMELVRARAAASVNHIFVAVCARVGTERGTAWVGQSAIVDPLGELLDGPGADDTSQLILAACDLASAADKQISDHNDVFADRRPDLYAAAEARSADHEATHDP